MLVVQENPGNPNGPGRLKFIDLAEKEKDVVVKIDDFYRLLTYSRDKTLVVLNVGKQQPHVRIVEVATGKVIRDLPTDTVGGVHKCLLSADNKILVQVSGFDRDLVYLWDVATGKQLYKRKAFALVESLGDLSPDGRLMAMILPGTMIQFFDFKTGEFAASFAIDGAQFQCLRFAPDGKTFAIGERNGRVRIFETPRLK
jgi:WD40 repeat protein